MNGVGKSSLFIMALLSFVTTYSMNTLLSQVRNLSLITHLIMMQLSYPAAVTIFYSGIFEYVTFDLIPTDTFYEDVFRFEPSEPYSEEAESIGYPSRYLIINSGSLTLFIFVIAIQQLVYSLIARFSEEKSRLNKKAKAKMENFRWAGMTDWVHEINLSMCYCIMINSTAFNFKTGGAAFNNVFMVAMAFLLFLWPFKVALSARKMWNAPLAQRKKDWTEEQHRQDYDRSEQQKEGGEQDSITTKQDRP